MRIKILKCSDPAYWYADMVNQEIKVARIDSSGSAIIEEREGLNLSVKKKVVHAQDFVRLVNIKISSALKDLEGKICKAEERKNASQTDGWIIDFQDYKMYIPFQNATVIPDVYTEDGHLLNEGDECKVAFMDIESNLWKLGSTIRYDHNPPVWSWGRLTIQNVNFALFNSVNEAAKFVNKTNNLLYNGKPPKSYIVTEVTLSDLFEDDGYFNRERATDLPKQAASDVTYSKFPITDEPKKPTKPAFYGISADGFRLIFGDTYYVPQSKRDGTFYPAPRAYTIDKDDMEFKDLKVDYLKFKGLKNAENWISEQNEAIAKNTHPVSKTSGPTDDFYKVSMSYKDFQDSLLIKPWSSNHSCDLKALADHIKMIRKDIFESPVVETPCEIPEGHKFIGLVRGGPCDGMPVYKGESGNYCIPTIKKEEPKIVKPPLGLMPEKLYNEKMDESISIYQNRFKSKRIRQIGKAKGRYKAAGLPIPNEWDEELTRLLKKNAKS